MTAGVLHEVLLVLGLQAEVLFKIFFSLQLQLHYLPVMKCVQAAGFCRNLH